MIITSPVIGILTLSPGHRRLSLSDKKAFSQFFFDVRESSRETPICDVLMLYCDIEVNGRVKGSAQTLREIIQDSGASIVIIATENHNDSYVVATQDMGFGYANLVMTVSRKEAAFETFFQRVFADMKQGLSMPEAWVKWAPQGTKQVEIPETAFLCEIGQISFQ